MLRGTAREDCDTKDFLSLSKKVLVTLIRFICSFFSTARRTNQEAPPLLSSFGACRHGRRRGLRNSLRSDSPRPFSSVFLATSPPDKGGIGGSCLYSNPLALWALPLYTLTETQGERGLTLLLPLLVFLTPLLVATLLSSPLYFFAPHTAMLRGTAREDCDTKDFLSLPKKVLVTLIRFICSFFLAARKTNQEAPPFLLTPPSLRTPPLYFAVQNTEEEIDSNPPLIAVRYSAYGARQGEKVEY